MKKNIHVAVGVLIDSDNRICVSRRQAGQHLAGFWEFPGGKVEDSENVVDALKREFKEELGVAVEESTKLTDVRFDYPEKTVWLDVHIIYRHSGVASGLEGQEVKWVSLKALDDLKFPEANVTILEKLKEFDYSNLVPGLESSDQ